MKTLLENGANPNAKALGGQTPLMLAAAMGDHPVKALLAKGADVNAKDNYTGETALINAVLANNIKTAKVLLENGADINAGDNFGKTPLFYAATDRHKLIAKPVIMPILTTWRRGTIFHLTCAMHSASFASLSE